MTLASCTLSTPEMMRASCSEGMGGPMGDGGAANVKMRQQRRVMASRILVNRDVMVRVCWFVCA